MCAECMNGFNSSSPLRKSEVMKESSKQPCEICKQPTYEKVCTGCLQTYVPQIQEFLEKHPGIIYLEAVLHKDMPIPRNVLYILQETGIIKLRDKR